MAKKRQQPMLPGMPRNRELLSNEARYKRGYTPARQKEIFDAFKNVDIDFVISDGPGDDTTNASSEITGPFKGQTKGLLNRSRQEVVSAVANSKINPKRIAGLSRIELHSGHVNNNPDIAGDFNPELKSIRISNGLEKKQKNVVQSTLRHEIGHHVTLPLINEATEKFNSQNKFDGAAEGLADNFANKAAGKKFRGRPTNAGYKVPAKETLKEKDSLFISESKIDWADGYVGALDKPTRSEIFNASKDPGMPLAYIRPTLPGIITNPKHAAVQREYWKKMTGKG